MQIIRENNIEKGTEMSTTEIKAAQELTDENTENSNETNEYGNVAVWGVNADSILVSVNARKTHDADKMSDEEELLADDEWMSQESEMLNDLSDAPSNNEDEDLDAEFVRHQVGITENGGLTDGSDKEVFDVEAFEDEEDADEEEDDDDAAGVDDREEDDDEVDEDEDGEEESDIENRKRINVKKVGCISCSAVLVLLIILLVSVTSIFYHYYHLMDINDDDSIYVNDKVTFSDTELSEVPDGKVDIEEGSVFKDKNVFNIMLIGTDERTKGFSKNARADSIMILSLDNSTKRIRLVSLERGMLVKIPGRKNDILTHTFRYGGSNLLMETVRTHFKLDVDKYIRVNFAMFQKLVDEVGGVDIMLTEEEARGLNTYPNHNTWKLKRKVVAGMNHFNGYEALQYSRLRWIDDDFHRIGRQRKVIIAIKDNMKDLSVSDLKDISADCLPYVQTNLSAMEFADLLIKMPGYFDNEVVQMTIPRKGTYQTLGNVDFKENSRILNDFLSGKSEYYP